MRGQQRRLLITMTEFILIGISIGLSFGVAIGLIIARFLPQKLDIGIGMQIMRPPHDEDADESEAWRGKG